MSHPAPAPAKEVEAPSKRSKKPATLINWKVRILFATLRNEARVAIVVGTLKDKRALQLVSKEMNGRLPESTYLGFGFDAEEFEDSRYVYSFASFFPDADQQRPNDVSHLDWYLCMTAGKLVKPGRAEQLRAKAKKRYGSDSGFITRMLENAAKKGCDLDNLCHLYALFMHYPRISFEMEKFFLWMVTGTVSNKKWSVSITDSMINELCCLLEAEQKFGIPVVDSEPMHCDRRNRLDLTYIISDLICTKGRQEIIGERISPIAPSLLCARGNPNPVRVTVANHYGLDVIPKGYGALD